MEDLAPFFLNTNEYLHMGMVVLHHSSQEGFSKTDHATHDGGAVSVCTKR
jgi:hypothetical protein